MSRDIIAEEKYVFCKMAFCHQSKSLATSSGILMPGSTFIPNDYSRFYFWFKSVDQVLECLNKMHGKRSH